MDILPAESADWSWIEAHSAPVGGRQVVSNGALHTLREHPAVLAWQEDQRHGFAVYRLEPPVCELLAILAIKQWHGTGSALLNFVETQARAQGCQHIWLSTTNDNLPALRFYQRRDYLLHRLRKGAFAEVMRLKKLDPNDRVVGHGGIAIRDELQLKKTL